MINMLCPKCRGELKLKDKSMTCEKGHCYDVAKEGYVNLLLVDKKHSLNPGDNKQMVMARDSFLEQGYYGFLADALAENIGAYKPETLLDAGCGCGYYLRRILDALANSCAIGVDISKDAVKVASKRDNRASYAVASVFDLPFDDGAFDMVTCVFSPYAFEEYARVLRDDGILIVVYPAEKHLYEIKELLYGDSVFENDKVVEPKGFTTDKALTLTKKITIDNTAHLKSLVAMTPYFYKTKASKIEALESVSHVDVTVSFNIRFFKKSLNK